MVVSNNLRLYAQETNMLFNMRVTLQTLKGTLYPKGRNLIWVLKIVIQASHLFFLILTSEIPLKHDFYFFLMKFHWKQSWGFF